MASGNNSSKTVWIVISVIAALLLGCTLGSCAGGLAGYGLSRIGASQKLPSIMAYESGTRIPQEPTLPGRRDGGITPLLVTQVVSDSPVDQAGLKPGDLIVALDNNKLGDGNTISSLLAGYKPGDMLVLTVVRGQRNLELEVVVGSHPDDQTAWLGFYYRQLDEMP